MRVVSAIVVVCAVSAGAWAQDINVVNSGFEEPALNPNGFTNAAPPGWVKVGGGGAVGVFYPTEQQWDYVAPFGNQVGYMNGAFIEQALEEEIQPGVPYKLLVDVVHRPDFFNGYTVELYAGDTIIASDTDSLDPPEGESLVLVLGYTAADNDPLIGQPIKIRLGGPSQANFDRVRLLTSCKGDCDDSGNLNILDFVCFQGLFTGGNPGADCDGNGVLNILDFVCFQGAFTDGCG
jgi:hypothetical protein